MSRGVVPDADPGQLPSVHLAQRQATVKAAVGDAHGPEEAPGLQPGRVGDADEGLPGVEENGRRRGV